MDVSGPPSAVVDNSEERDILGVKWPLAKAVVPRKATREENPLANDEIMAITIPTRTRDDKVYFMSCELPRVKGLLSYRRMWVVTNEPLLLAPGSWRWS